MVHFYLPGPLRRAFLFSTSCTRPQNLPLVFSFPWNDYTIKEKQIICSHDTAQLHFEPDIYSWQSQLLAMSASFINMHSESDRKRVWVSTRWSCEITALSFFFSPPMASCDPQPRHQLCIPFISAPRWKTRSSILPPSTRESFSANHRDYSGIHNQSTVPLGVLRSIVAVCRGSQEGSNYVCVCVCALRGSKSQDTLIASTPKRSLVLQNP